MAVTRRLAHPCPHAASKHAHRVSSHSDAEVDAAGGISSLPGAFCSVWVCSRDACVEAAKRYVSYYTMRAPVVQGKRGATA